jgi:hypothetical protein
MVTTGQLGRLGRVWLGLALAAALLRAVLPAGFMIGTPSTPGSNAGFIEICGAGLQHDEAVALHVNGSDTRGETPGKPQRDTESCPFGSLTQAALSALSPTLASMAEAYILDRGVRTTPLPAAQPAAERRPPVRGPPAH